MIDRQIYRKDRQIDRQKDRKIERQKDRKIERQKDRQIDRQIDREGESERERVLEMLPCNQKNFAWALKNWPQISFGLLGK